VVSELNSQLKGRRFESHLIQNTRWKWGLKTCQDRFFHPILVRFRKKKKNTGSQMVHTNKKEKKLFLIDITDIG